MDETEITWEMIEQISDEELQELLTEEAQRDFTLEQVVVIRQWIKVAGDLESALELLETVFRSKEAA